MYDPYDYSHDYYPCWKNPDTGRQYQVVFIYGDDFRLSTAVRADSIGEAVFAASKKITNKTQISLSALRYDSCIPVR